MARRPIAEDQEINLAPILNIVMILIPLTLLSASFVVVATLKVSSGSQVTPSAEPPAITTPRVLVAVTSEGFQISDLRNLPEFIEHGFHSTIELRDLGESTGLMGRLNYRELYNRLAAIRDHETWRDAWQDHSISLVADREVGAETVIRVMDIARYRLGMAHYQSDADFRRAVWAVEDGQPMALFDQPSLLLPRAQD